MFRVPIDSSGLKRKLDVQWMRGILGWWLDESDGHVVLTPHGTVTGRTMRRLAGNLQVQPDMMKSSRVEFKIQLCLKPNF